MKSEQEALVDEVKRITDEWVSVATRILTGGELITFDSELSAAIKKAHLTIPTALSEDDLTRIFQWCLGGVAHSFLTMLDGGTMLADSFRISVRGPSGDELAGGLHEMLD